MTNPRGVPVAVAIDLPRLELDRPFTYLLSEEHVPGTGLLVSVAFHGRTVRGWVLGPTDEVPSRVLSVRRVLSRVPLFDERGLRLARWVSERYVVPLSVAIDRMHPPRVAGEEERLVRAPTAVSSPSSPPVLEVYGGGRRLLDACRSGSGTFIVRPLPDHEAGACVEAVAACLAGGRDAIVLVPEAEPLPATGRAVIEAFGSAAVSFAGGDRRRRYATWLAIRSGAHRVAVGTRPAVFSPLPNPGLVWIHREAHPGHREERTPAYHVREVALARSALEGSTCVLAGLAPSTEAAALADDGGAVVVRPPRGVERGSAPLVETARPTREDRSPRLARLLRDARGAFLLVGRLGSGVARVCRDCGEPVRCGACAGPVEVRSGRPTCSVCGTDAACTTCGSTRFGLERGGLERVAEWASRVTRVPVRALGEGAGAEPPGPGRVLVGGPAAVKDLGPARVPLVGILDADRSRRRAGLGAPAHVLATWMEAAAWAGPRSEGGRVLLHTREPGDPTIQALVRWDPWSLHRVERARRESAGFPPNHPIFRVTGSPDLPRVLGEHDPVHLLASSRNGQAVCLVTLRPEDLPRFRERVLAWAQDGTVTRVEAEPQL